MDNRSPPHNPACVSNSRWRCPAEWSVLVLNGLPQKEKGFIQYVQCGTCGLTQRIEVLTASNSLNEKDMHMDEIPVPITTEERMRDPELPYMVTRKATSVDGFHKEMAEIVHAFRNWPTTPNAKDTQHG